VQQDFRAENVVARLREIIPEGLARTRMLQGLALVKSRLRSPEESMHPADRAAKIILSVGISGASKQM